MKALSLWQPWATLWVLGCKIHETRGWSTQYRGPIAVHAAKRWTPEQMDYLKQEPFCNLLRDHLRDGPEPLPLGAFVGVVNIDKCMPTLIAKEHTTTLDLLLGDWAPGRFAWRASESYQLAEPIPAKGQQGLWTPDALAVDRIYRLLAEQWVAQEIRRIEHDFLYGSAKTEPAGILGALKSSLAKSKE